MNPFFRHPRHKVVIPTSPHPAKDRVILIHGIKIPFLFKEINASVKVKTLMARSLAPPFKGHSVVQCKIVMLCSRLDFLKSLVKTSC